MAGAKNGLHEWISLLDISGPFLSLNCLNKALPMGLDALPKGLRGQFQLAYEEWFAEENAAIHSTWINWVLTAVLEFDDEVLLQGSQVPQELSYREDSTQELVRPTHLIVSVDDPPKPLLPIIQAPQGQKVGSPLQGARWNASPIQRMQALLKANKITHGLVTNGSEWTLIHVRESEATGYITFRSDVMADEELLLRAFISLLGLRRIVGAPAGESLADLLIASRDDEEELTLDLGRQVRESVELLAREMDRLDEESGRTLLAAWKDEDLYRGCLTVMMRLMFLLCAEERKLLPTESVAYTENYAASTLLSQLEVESTEQGEEILERRYDAWLRLMALARLVHSGCCLPELAMTAYGGSLFDPEAHPFLELLKVNNRVTLHVLESLQYILVKGAAGNERRRISFEALDVEQIGYVYEGLLDHTLITAKEPVLGLIGKATYEPELGLSELESLRAKPRQEMLKALAKETSRSVNAIEKLLSAPLSSEKEAALRLACQGDLQVFDQVKFWANLIRPDTLGRLQVYLKDSRYVTSSSERRGTGTHYTPRFLAEEMVEHTLAPLIYKGMAEGWPKEKWVKKSATELLNLRIADIAMGSGAFLVAVCRHLSAKVAESWNELEAELSAKFPGARLVCTESGELQAALDPHNPQPESVETSQGILTPYDPSRNEPLPLEEEERLAIARSMVVDRCLYGVDINPMAAEMAKLSLWLITMRRDRPFHFVDHALKSGDSLVGVTLNELKNFSLDLKPVESSALLLPWLSESVTRVVNLRSQIRQWPGSTDLGVENRRLLHERAEEDEVALRVAADLLLTQAFEKAETGVMAARLAMLQTRPEKEKARSLGSILGRRSFHFELEFADVFAEGGFDAIVGNPPFVGGQKITGSMGDAFRDYIVARVAGGKAGSADLCAYFFLRSASLLKQGGTFGLLATNTISEGDTRGVGLDQLLKPPKEGGPAPATAYRAVKSIKWPSKSANLEVAKVWLYKGGYSGPKRLEGEEVDAISPLLDSEEGDRTPKVLLANKGLSFQGSIVLGKGFVLEPQEAQDLLNQDPSLKPVLFPYLNGEDLNQQVAQKPSRWVINFHDWPLGRVGQNLPVSGEEVTAVARATNPARGDEWFPDLKEKWHDPSRTPEGEEKKQKQWLQMGVVPRDYPGPVAADYPAALAIVEEKVRPERAKLFGQNTTATDRAIRWWKYGRRSEALYSQVRPLSRCICTCRHSQYHNFAWTPTNIVMSEATVVIASDRDGHFTLVQSLWHQIWTEINSSSLETRQRYTPSDCFETFPLPSLTPEMDEAGKALDEARQAAMEKRQIGLTDVSKLMHNPTMKDADIETLRQSVIANDAAVSAAYGWENLELEHGFYDLGRGPRFTVSPSARKEMLRRLLAENHRRAAEEEAARNANPDSAEPKKGKRNSKPTSTQADLFGDGELIEEER